MRESSLEEWLGGLGLESAAGLLLPGWQGGLVAADSSLGEAPVWPAGFDAVLEPMLAQAEGELLRQAPAGLLCCGGGPIPYREMLGNLRLRVRGIMTLPLALVCARHEGDSATRTTVDKAWRECVARYSLLEPLLSLAKRQWVAGALLFLRRLQHDADMLAAWLGLPCLPQITEVSGTGSDGHDWGQAVLAITFASGQRIFYKPRPVTGEFLWRALLAEMSADDEACSLPAARVLPGGLGEEEASRSRTNDLSRPDPDNPGDPMGNLGNSYGWMEALSTHAAPTSDQYWERAGGLLCVAQHVALTDLHVENVVRGEAGPAVVDAECLGSSAIVWGPTACSSAVCGAATGTEEAVSRAIEEMLETGLLSFAAPPASGSLGSGSLRSDAAGLNDIVGMDVSGLFGRPALAPSLRLPYWRCSQDRLPQLALTPARLRTNEGAKQGQGATLSPLAVLPHLLRGYRRAARALMSVRRRLLASGGWLDTLDRFHGARAVVRPTLAYALLVSRSLGPDCLASVAARRSAVECWLKEGLTEGLKDGRSEGLGLALGDGTGESRSVARGDGIPSAVREAEADALMALDLPRFIVPARTRALALSSGRVVVPQLSTGKLAGSTPGCSTPGCSTPGCSIPTEAIRCRLEALSEETLESVHVPALTMACLAARVTTSNGISNKRIAE